MKAFSNYIKKVRVSGKCYFTLIQAAKETGSNREAILSAIYRKKKSGDIISPAKGLYIIVPPEHQSVGCIPAKELIPILMGYYQAEYYVCLLSAAMIHGASHQQPGSFQVISNKRIKKQLTLGEVRIDFIYKKSLKSLPIQEIVVETGYLKLSSPELTSMDLLLYQRKSGGVNHIATVLSELIDSIKVDKMAKLIETSGKMFWVQRIGYIIEHISHINIEIKEPLLKELSSFLDNKKVYPIPIAPEAPIKNCKIDKKWMIIENLVVQSDLDDDY